MCQEQKGVGHVIAQEELVVAGIDVCLRVFEMIDQMDSERYVCDGQVVKPGEEICKTSGKLQTILTGERVALNFLQRMSGIATLSRKYVDAINGYKTKIVDTRKTTPGMRILEKYAVKVGGARNHRFGLFDGILIKDNHIIAAGGITSAVQSARKNVSHMMKIEVEVGSIAECIEALEAGADVIMLDNMDIDEMKEAVAYAGGKVLIEASGKVALERVVDIAKTGVDLISIGSLTHSFRSTDITMEIECLS